MSSNNQTPMQSQDQSPPIPLLNPNLNPNPNPILNPDLNSRVNSDPDLNSDPSSIILPHVINGPEDFSYPITPPLSPDDETKSITSSSYFASPDLIQSPTIQFQPLHSPSITEYTSMDQVGNHNLNNLTFSFSDLNVAGPSKIPIRKDYVEKSHYKLDKNQQGTGKGGGGGGGGGEKGKGRAVSFSGANKDKLKFIKSVNNDDKDANPNEGRRIGVGNIWRAPQISSVIKSVKSRDKEGVGTGPNTNTNINEGIGGGRGNTRSKRDPKAIHLPLNKTRTRDREPARQESMTASIATSYEVKEISLSPNPSSIGWFDGPCPRQDEGIFRWLGELCIGAVLCQCCPCARREPAYGY